MPKHKKTLEQKRKLDSKRISSSSPQISTGPQPSPTFQLSSYIPIPHAHTPSVKESTGVIAHGLEKTVIVSFAIIAIELAIFFLLTHHIFVLPQAILKY